MFPEKKAINAVSDTCFFKHARVHEHKTPDVTAKHKKKKNDADALIRAYVSGRNKKKRHTETRRKRDAPQRPEQPHSLIYEHTSLP